MLESLTCNEPAWYVLSQSEQLRSDCRCQNQMWKATINITMSVCACGAAQLPQCQIKEVQIGVLHSCSVFIRLMLWLNCRRIFNWVTTISFHILLNSLLIKLNGRKFAYLNACRNPSLKTDFIHVGNKVVYCVFNTCCTISVLFSRNSVYFMMFSFSVHIINISSTIW